VKRKEYTDIICNKFCRFYKEGRDETSCGTYRFLADRFTACELGMLVSGLSKNPVYSCDAEVREFICSACDFLVDGCDFREGADVLPCGGYSIIEGLISRGKMSW